MNFSNLFRTKKHDLYRHAKFGYDPKKNNETAAKSANWLIYFETDYKVFVIYYVKLKRSDEGFIYFLRLAEPLGLRRFLQGTF